MAERCYEFSGWCSICESNSVFVAYNDWYRDHLKCQVCDSIPRERALMRVIDAVRPAWRSLRIHESSPVQRGASQKLSVECHNYVASQLYPDIKLGDTHDRSGHRCENLEGLTLASRSVDIFVTQDVMEHVFEPSLVFQEIERVLADDGVYICTVPLVRKDNASRRRSRLIGGSIEHLLEPEYHGNPVSSDGSLVTIDWGFDITRYSAEVSNLTGEIHNLEDQNLGILGEYLEVLVFNKASSTKSSSEKRRWGKLGAL